MAKEFYNYGPAAQVSSKVKDGMHSQGYQYTTNVYYSAETAGPELGVDTDKIEVVLKFDDDGKYSQGKNVDPTPARGFVGGATQFSHSGRPKPVAKRKITETNWTDV